MRETFGFSSARQRQRRLGFVHLVLLQADGLVEAFGPGRFQAGLFELLNGVSLRLAQSFAARIAAFQRIVSKKLDVVPPGLAVELCRRRGLLRSGESGKSQKQKYA